MPSSRFATITRGDERIRKRKDLIFHRHGAQLRGADAELLQGAGHLVAFLRLGESERELAHALDQCFQIRAGHFGHTTEALQTFHAGVELDGKIVEAVEPVDDGFDARERSNSCRELAEAAHHIHAHRPSQRATRTRCES